MPAKPTQHWIRRVNYLAHHRQLHVHRAPEEGHSAELAEGTVKSRLHYALRTLQQTLPV
jgi:hypothetical protein